MKCARCGSEMENDWRFCPRCGHRKGASPADAFGRDLFSKMFSKMNMDKMFDREMQALDLSPFFRSSPPNSGQKPIGKRGFTVHIKTGTDMKPKVDVQTFGNVNREKLEKEVEGKFGIKVPQKKAERRFLPSIRRTSAPKTTEEPKADVKRIGDRVLVDVDIPGVKSEEYIGIRELGSSVEIKAIADEKGYFKILTKPENFRLTSRSFSDGKLHLEFS